MKLKRMMVVAALMTGAAGCNSTTSTIGSTDPQNTDKAAQAEQMGGDTNQGNHGETAKQGLNSGREVQRAPVGNPPSSEAVRDAIDSQKLLVVPGVPNGVLKVGMDYADFRREILAKGWTPVTDAQCQANVDGGDKLCEKMPELSTCSVDGYCLMHFSLANTNKIMEVGTYGDAASWDAMGKDSQLAVTGSNISEKK